MHAQLKQHHTFARIATRLTACIWFAALSTFAQADTYPSKPITLVVPNPPDGLVDTSARLVSEPLARLTGQSVVVDNKPGGSGNLAYSNVARSAKDGYTVLVSYSGQLGQGDQSSQHKVRLTESDGVFFNVQSCSLLN